MSFFKGKITLSKSVDENESYFDETDKKIVTEIINRCDLNLERNKLFQVKISELSSEVYGTVKTKEKELKERVYKISLSKFSKRDSEGGSSQKDLFSSMKTVVDVDGELAINACISDEVYEKLKRIDRSLNKVENGRERNKITFEGSIWEFVMKY